jgi:hypothetical protein
MTGDIKLMRHHNHGDTDSLQLHQSGKRYRSGRSDRSGSGSLIQNKRSSVSHKVHISSINEDEMADFVEKYKIDSTLVDDDNDDSSATGSHKSSHVSTRKNSLVTSKPTSRKASIASTAVSASGRTTSLHGARNQQPSNESLNSVARAAGQRTAAP